VGPVAGSSPINPLQVASLEEELQLVRKALRAQMGCSEKKEAGFSLAFRQLTMSL
jgi:hypothetical protein